MHLRWFIFLNLVLLILPSIFAEEILMEAGASIIRNGKNITFIGTNQEFANFKVDGVYGKVAKGESNKIGGVLIHLVTLAKNPPKIIFELTIDFTCGDQICGAGEDDEICCLDCGCGSETKICVANQCVQNITLSLPPGVCLADSDCEDNKACTLNTCDITQNPAQCISHPVTQCTPNDMCCPTGCTSVEDSDCKVINQCTSDAQCDDANACTTTACSGTPRKCVTLTSNAGCSLQTQCVDVGTVSVGTYCSSEGTFYSQKKLKESCTAPYECFSMLCTFGSCREKTTFELISRWIFYVSMSLALFILLFYVSTFFRKPTT